MAAGRLQESDAAAIVDSPKLSAALVRVRWYLRPSHAVITVQCSSVRIPA